MSPATLERPNRESGAGAGARRGPRQARGASADTAAATGASTGGERRLEDLVVGAWERLCAEGQAECLVCGGQLLAGSGCRQCGAVLS